MARKNPRTPEPPAFVRAQRPRLAPEVNQSNHSFDLPESQMDWQARVDAGLIKVVR